MGLCLSPISLLWHGYKAPGIVTGTVLRPVRCVTGTVASALRWLAEPPPGYESIAVRCARIEARFAAAQQQRQSTGADRANDPDTSTAAGASVLCPSAPLLGDRLSDPPLLGDRLSSPVESSIRQALCRLPLTCASRAGAGHAKNRGRIVGGPATAAEPCRRRGRGRAPRHGAALVTSPPP